MGVQTALQAVSHPHRREILRLVWDAEMSSREIASHFDVTWQTVSHNLRVLREAGLVSERRDGTRRLYRTARDVFANPYAYAHTTRDVFEVRDRVEKVARSQSSGFATGIDVFTQQNWWPLPWYLRGYRHVLLGDKIPADPYAPLMIVAKQFNAHLDDSKTHLMVEYFELRPGVFFELYVELNAWKAYLAKHPPRPEPDVRFAGMAGRAR